MFKTNFLKFLFLYLVATFFLIGCLPSPENKVSTQIITDINDPKVQTVLELQDRQQTDSLIHLLGSTDATTRYWATMAFASIKDKRGIDSLARRLSDNLDSIKIAAAYALGQIGDSTAQTRLLSAFNSKDSLDGQLNKYILEAMGKCGTRTYLELMSTVTTYRVSDTTLLEGQALGIYHFMLRKIVLASGTKRMLELVNSQYPDKVRLLAANYLARASNLGMDTLNVDSSLAVIFQREANPNVKMALALGLGKTKTDFAKATLLSAFQTIQDGNIKCNIIRSLKNFDYQSIRDTILSALKDQNLHVAYTINDYLLSNGIARDANTYKRLASDSSLVPAIRIGLLTAANKHMPSYFTDYKFAINADLQQLFKQSQDVYLKAQSVRGMGYYVKMYRYIADSILTSDSPILKTAAMEALVTICDSESFDATFGAAAKNTSIVIGNLILGAMKNGDAGVIAVGAAALRSPARDFKTTLADSIPILEQILQQIHLPYEIESYNELLHTIAYFKGIEFSPIEPEYNHPINWDILQALKPSKQILLQTNKGDITLQLMPEVAPGTVANFIALIKAGYYNNKVFHRVVPNFVIQGGCSRGDGYGGLKYTIRSELFPIHYNEPGLVGMASAGNHTEGTQFFITHSPALHLNGNYTIFAKVIIGMEIVNAIQVGDQIRGVSLL